METKKGHGEGHGRKGFKSYYVVWKRLFFCAKDEKDTCLNRTMQYGN